MPRLFRIAVALAALTPIGVVAPACAQDAGSAFYQRYHLAGELLRASLVCASETDTAWFFKATTALYDSAEFRTFSTRFKETMASWMESGAVAFNRRVQSEGAPAACAFARTERDRAMRLASSPISARVTHPDNQHEQDKRYQVVFRGVCKHRLPDRADFAPCNGVVKFSNYKIGRSAFAFIGADGAVFAFEGGRDRQPDPEHYKLYVDQAKIGDAAGRTDGAWKATYGECSMRLNADGSQYFEIGCDLFNLDSRRVYTFTMSPITSFVREHQPSASTMGAYRN